MNYQNFTVCLFNPSDNWVIVPTKFCEVLFMRKLQITCLSALVTCLLVRSVVATLQGFCDDRRSPWWATRVRPQHDRSRSDTIMISMYFNSYARLYFSSFLFFFLFCFWTQNFIYYTSVSCVWFLLPYLNLQSNWAWKLLKLGLSILFYLWGFLSLLTLQ